MADLVTPCHGVPFLTLLGWEGPSYLEYQVVSEYLCTAKECYNSWDENGKEDKYNVYNDSQGV